MRNERGNRTRKSTNYILQRGNILVIAMCSFFAQLVKTHIFPAKYFYDAVVVFNAIGEENLFDLGDSFEITSFLFDKVQKIVPFSTIQQWNIGIWIVMGIFTMRLLQKRINKYNQSDLLIWIMGFGYMVLLPIFCWNTQKETIQYAFSFLLLICAGFCEAHAHMTKRCVVMVSSLLFAWGILFRNYYLLIACLFLIFETGLCIPYEKYRKTDIYRVVICVMLMIFGVFLLVYMCKSNIIYQVLNSRMNVNKTRIGSSDANTIILDMIHNYDDSFVIYIINYLINAVRMLLPFELILKGKKYILYIGVQLFMSIMLAAGVRTFCYVVRNKLEKKSDAVSGNMKILLGIMLAWYIVAFVFEPDFGSFLRHQVAMFPVFLPIYCFVLEKRRKYFLIFRRIK